jgi:hypothetical protein
MVMMEDEKGEKEKEKEKGILTEKEKKHAGKSSKQEKIEYESKNNEKGKDDIDDTHNDIDYEKNEEKKGEKIAKITEDSSLILLSGIEDPRSTVSLGNTTSFSTFGEMSIIEKENENENENKNKIGDVRIENKKSNNIVKEFLYFLVGKSVNEERIIIGEFTTSLPSSTSPSNPNLILPSPITENTTSFSTLWGREIKYSHIDRGGLFSSFSASNQSVFQIMKINTKKTSGVENMKKNENEKIAKKSHDHGNDVISGNSNLMMDSVTVIGYTDLSHMPYCKDCSYTVRWEFSNIEINGKGNYKSNNKLKNNEIKNNSKMGTAVSVFLNIECPPSLYRSFIISGIKKEIKNIADKFFSSAKIILEDNDFMEKIVRGEGELKLLKTIEKDIFDYEKISDDGKEIEMNKNENVYKSNYENENEPFNKNLNKNDDTEFVINQLYGFATENNEKIRNEIYDESETLNYSPDIEITSKFVILRDHW